MLAQLERTKLGDSEGGMYDPHIAGPRTAKTEAPKQYVTVVSSSIAGPVLLAEDAATVILKALARGGFSCAVKLRDVLDSVSALRTLSAIVEQALLYGNEGATPTRARSAIAVAGSHWV